MADIKIKRGLDSNLPTSASEGEPLYSTDTRRLFIGNGIGNDLTEIGGLSGFTLGTKTIKIPITTSGAQSTYVIPSNSIVRKTEVIIEEVYTIGTLIDVIVNGTSPLTIMDSSYNNPEELGVYSIDEPIEVGSLNTGVVDVSIAGSPTVGSGYVLITIIENFLS